MSDRFDRIKRAGQSLEPILAKAEKDIAKLEPLLTKAERLLDILERAKKPIPPPVALREALVQSANELLSVREAIYIKGEELLFHLEAETPGEGPLARLKHVHERLERVTGRLYEALRTIGEKVAPRD